jgi:3-oxoacyl-(acyl-carrier-protein) synthase
MVIPLGAQELPNSILDAEGRVTLSGTEPCFVDHRIGGKGILPAAVSLQLAVGALARHYGVSASCVVLAGVTWVRPCVADGEPVHLHFSLESSSGTEVSFQIQRRRESGAREVLCEGRARLASGEDAPMPCVFFDGARLTGSAEVSAEKCYEFLDRVGMAFGPAHRPIRSLWPEAGRVVSRLESKPSGLGGGIRPELQFVMLDGAIHSLVGFAAGLGRSTGNSFGSVGTLAPFSVEQVRMHRDCDATMWAVLQSRVPSVNEERAGIRRFDIHLHDATGVVSVELLGVSCRAWGPNLGTAAPGVASPKAADHLPASSDEAVRFLKRQIASVLKIPLDRISVETPFTEFGLDSALAVALTRHLETIFGPLSTTLFFECRNLGELAESLGQSHRVVLDQCLGTGRSPASIGKSEDLDGGMGKPLSVSAAPTEVPRQRPGTEGSLDIAIIGLAGRYPGARSLDEFWQNLCAGRDCITEIPATRWHHAAYFDPSKNQPGKTYSKWGGFLDGVDEFDAKFFNISPWEAEMIDPQERLFLQCAFEGVEDSGYTRESLGRGGRVGVYVGVMYAEYQLYGASETALGRPLSLFSSPASIANRVSYFGNFRGPSLAVDTMCSSSLTAIHLACQSLVRGETEVALAGGVNLSVHPNKYLVLGQGRFVSSKGRCESFGEGAEGYVPGEGVGVVVLKPLAAAVAAGDHIYGVIKGSAVNHGGRNNGYTVPNPQAQAEVVELALRESGVDPRTISYVEAHGTGTSLGDPIEVAGLRKAYGKFTDHTGFCALGSVKSNIGHCESAAGVAGLTKLLLQMAHEKLVPSLHSGTLNRHIDFEHSPFVVQQALAAWKRPNAVGNGHPEEVPLRAGLSSFGAGGSNAHLIVEEFSGSLSRDHAAVTSGGESGPALIVLSARTPAALQQTAANLGRHLLESGTAQSLRDVAYTLQAGREAFEHRLAFVADSVAEAVGKLSASGTEATSGEIFRGQVRPNDEVLSLFSSDDQLKAAVQAWVAQRKFVPLLELWVKGLRVDWRLLYTDQPRRVRLPTYPFARDRFWIPLGSPAEAVPEFDEAFYAGLLKGVESGDLSVTEAVEREQTHAGAGRRVGPSRLPHRVEFPGGNGHSEHDRGGKVS